MKKKTLFKRLFLFSLAAFAGVVLLMWGLSAYIMDGVFPWVKKVGSTRDLSIVEITLKPSPESPNLTKLKIPKAYITWRPNWSGGEAKFVLLSVARPSFEPWSIYKGQRELSLDKKNLEIPITLHAINNELIIEHLWQFHLKKLSLIGDGSQAESNGYLVYKPRAEHRNKNDLSFYLVPNFETESFVFYRCFGDNPYYRCRGHVAVSSTLWMKFSLPQKDIDLWGSILPELRRFIATFEVK